MRAGQLICILVCFIVLMVVSGGCAYTKKDVVEIPCAVADNISYTADIAPIIEANCAGCHSAASLTSGILLDNYDGLKYYAQNGYLYGDISHAPGFRAMPDGEAKLNNCIIATIKKWIDTGTPH